MIPSINLKNKYLIDLFFFFVNQMVIANHFIESQIKLQKHSKENVTQLELFFPLNSYIQLSQPKTKETTIKPYT